MKISVIVPIYKVEKYLPACIDSILAQTHTDLEIILVDDGSPDGCPALCDGYAAQDSRVRVIHQKNGGVSAARNRGLDAATGECIAFCDGDDFVPPDAYAALLAAAQRENAEVAVGDFVYLTNQGSHTAKTDRRNPSNKKNLLYPTICVTNKLYLRQFLVDSTVRFRPFTVGEDVVFTTEIYTKANRVASIRQAAYHYYTRGEARADNPSLSAQRTPQALWDSARSLHAAIELAAAVQDEVLMNDATACLNVLKNNYFLVSHGEREAFFGEMQEIFRLFKTPKQHSMVAHIFRVPYDQLVTICEPDFLRMLATRDCYREMQERCVCGEVGLRYLLGCLCGWAEFKWHRLWKDS